MKIKLIFSLLIFLLASNCYAQTTFQKVINNDSLGQIGYAVEQTTDGGYIIAGASNVGFTGPINAALYLIKTNIEGAIVWTKIYGGTGNNDDNVGYSVQQTTDSGYIVVGRTSPSLSGPSHFYVVKTNVIGDTLWTKSYGGTSYDIGEFIRQTTDGGYIITGSTESFGAGGDDVYLIKINAAGVITWTKTYGGNLADGGNCVRQTSDSGYVIVGSTSSFGAGNDDVYLIKTDANGDTLWTKTYGGADNDEGYSVQQTSDSGYIIAGSTQSFGDSSSIDVYLIKTDPAGDTLWTKTYGGGGEEYGYEVQQTTDGGYIIAGSTANSNDGNDDVYLIKTKGNGDTLWTKTYGGTIGDFAYSVSQTKDSGYIVTGLTDDFVTPWAGIYLIKTDANGNSDCNQTYTSIIVGTPATQIESTKTTVSSGGAASTTTTIAGSAGKDSTLCGTFVGIINEPSISNLNSIYPNPATNQLSIHTSSFHNEAVTVSVMNMLGQEILPPTSLQKGGEDAAIYVGNLPAGMYFLQLKWGSGSVVKRFVKE